MNTNPVALKEWASAIEALTEGRQIMLMRKGGIAEETKRFELKSHSFYLYPTYEHQRRELLKEQHRDLVEHTLIDWKDNAREIGLTAYAEAVHDLEIHDLNQLELLYPYHIWSEGLAAERLRWKAKEPLQYFCCAYMFQKLRWQFRCYRNTLAAVPGLNCFPRLHPANGARFWMMKHSALRRRKSFRHWDGNSLQREV